MVDVLIAGGGLGGCAAALAACSQGCRVLMTEETDWIGGQVTSQAVPLDEHPWIEETGCTQTYRLYRRKIRDYYFRSMPLSLSVDNLAKTFNPGNALVSNIAHDPRVSLQVLYEMLSPYLLTGKLEILLNTVVKRVKKRGKRIEAATLRTAGGAAEIHVKCGLFLDATETGELLPLSETEYVTGAESKKETGEPHAGEEADPHNIQAFTHVLAMEYREGEDHTIKEPEMYSFWKSFHPDIWPNPLLSFTAPHPITLENREYSLFGEDGKFSLWNYRRIFDNKQFNLGDAGDVALLNWPQNDYFLGNVYDVANDEKKKHLFGAKQLSLSLFYWLQTEAPNPSGGTGFPGLKLRGDVMGTRDGFAKAPYIRESRRLKAEYTIREQDVSPEFNSGYGKGYEDSIGVGSYSIDLHPSMSGKTYIDIPALPFQIPLGALIPRETENLLPCCKNIGTTHITNGCYRLHPVEWNIGEACGHLAAYCIQRKVNPKTVRENKSHLQKYQETLRTSGIQLHW
ncbi:FAD-dependent oxidoreductase [Falsibacillus pallidus]|uniref:FAD dependent oxidoreductase n=1 Tax=Falsibacillus pallidus TaxID=493781 RepID=A0A370G885_9BACI|nr:FAD-dependent oxidoreductase [Falsibacillus pallidus]RDI39998.1 FAD dependent oxidoreductase [Falsibacillus pallidus]